MTVFFSKLTSLWLALLTALLGGVLLPVPNITATPAAEALSQDLTVMTYNVKVTGVGQFSPEARSRGVASLVLEQMPDSVGFEEVNAFWLDALSAALGDTYAFVGEGRDGDGGGECSPVFYRRDKYALVDSGTFWLSPTPEEASRGWDAWINRVCSYAVLRDIETGFCYAHLNAHFDNSGAVSRLQAVAVVAEQVKALGDIPVVFSGDLNAKEGGYMYARLVDAGFCDTKYAAVESDSGRTYHGYTATDTDGAPIDYIFTNNLVGEVYSYSILREKADGVYPSDHFPIVVRLRFAQPEL